MTHPGWSVAAACLLGWALWSVGSPFAEAAVFAGALCAAAWPWAGRLRASWGRRASSLALAGLLALGAGSGGAWAWGHAFSELDGLIGAWEPARASAGAPWEERVRARARARLGEMRSRPAWAARVEGSKQMPWGNLGMAAILAYFMLADGAQGLAWARRVASGLGPAATEGLESGLSAFAQTAKGCLWFGTGSLMVLWALFAWAGAPSPLAFAVAGACASMLPFVAPVMVAAVAASLMGPGNMAGPLALLAVGAGGLGLANNVLRPKWVGDSAGIPMPAALLGMAGGAVAWGPAGLLCGPAAVAIALSWARCVAARGDSGEA